MSEYQQKRCQRRGFCLWGWMRLWQQHVFGQGTAPNRYLLVLTEIEWSPRCSWFCCKCSNWFHESGKGRTYLATKGGEQQALPIGPPRKIGKHMFFFFISWLMANMSKVVTKMVRSFSLLIKILLTFWVAHLHCDHFHFPQMFLFHLVTPRRFFVVEADLDLRRWNIEWKLRKCLNDTL